MKYASFFAGVGGIDLAFKNAGFEGVYANEIDKYPAETLKLNFPDMNIEVKNIKEVDISKIPNFDILLAGFPCQSFSIAGYRKGFEDERGELFFDVLKIVKEKKPRFVFLENVKNLVGHDGGKTFEIILESLEKNGYKVKYKVMNASEYGDIPQNRERIYIVAFKYKKDYQKFEFPNPQKLNKKVSDIFDINVSVDEKYYYTENKCTFYGLLEEGVTSQDTLYQWRRKYVRENKSKLCPTLTANMGTGGHNVPIIKAKNGIRKLTPQECFMFQGFPKNYKLPEQADGRLYKQAGNSVVVPVIERVAQKIINL